MTAAQTSVGASPSSNKRAAALALARTFVAQLVVVTSRRLADLVFVLLALLPSCATHNASGTRPLVREQRPTAAAPAADVQPSDASATPGVPEETDASARGATNAEGQQAFFRVCAPCHVGMWHVPTGGPLGPDERAEAAVRRQIRQGSASPRAGMPPIDERTLPDSTLDALIEYLRSTRVVASASPR